MRLTHPDPFATRWRARWIWHKRPAIGAEAASSPALTDRRDTVALLRRTLVLATVPGRAPARCWVDGRYILRVNGVEVGRGPVRSDPRRPHYDVVDLAPHLVVGENVLAIVARHYGAATSWWMPARPTYSLGGGSVVFEALVGEGWIVSDRSWLSRGGEAWTSLGPASGAGALPLESFDASLHPSGWDRPGFDASEWRPAFEITPFHSGSHGDPHPPSEPFGVLRPPVRVAFPGGERQGGAPSPVTGRDGAEPVDDPVDQVAADERSRVAPDGPVRIVAFDLGRVACGTVELTVQDAPVGTQISVAAAEHLDGEGRLAPLGQHAGFRFVAAGTGRESFETFDLVGARYLHASIRSPHPRRHPSTAPHLELSLRERLRPRPAGASFACSDPVLERIHAVGLRTVDLCALDSYVDCPTREQRAWTGDSVVHQMVDLVANPDWSMARWHPQLAAATRSDGMLPMAAACDFAGNHHMFVPDWSLHWVRSVHNLYRYTGDRDLVGDLLPVAEQALRWFEPFLGADGLLDRVSGWVLLDWASVYSEGSSSTLNALWARALEDLAEMAAWIGNHATAAWARRLYSDVAGAFDRFWDERRGVYIDHVVDGVARRSAAQHGGAAALAAGLVPAPRIGRVVERLTDRTRLLRHSWAMDTVTPEGEGIGYLYLTSGYPAPDWDVEEQMVAAEPFFRYVLHDGLARAGRSDLVADLCRDWAVFLERGETSWPECWNGGTHCHGWSSTPTRDLVVHTLGVTPAEPGYAAVRVAPALGDLEWARATVPTPHGPVTVEARADGSLQVDSPVPVIRGAARG
ncbi:MAG: family 78 glycoside hydrolase catalytic domain [Acidobacteriota bacterium]|nr:family 78 glycoside hydrolase catalytic domain [Acidobacteriota bacterium]